MNLHWHDLIRVTDLSGVLFKAAIGATIAGRVGWTVLAGGLIRDVVLQQGLPGALADPAYLVTAIAEYVRYLFWGRGFVGTHLASGEGVRGVFVGQGDVRGGHAKYHEGPEGLARRLATAYLDAWEDSTTGARLLVIAHAVSESPIAAALVRDHLRQFLSPSTPRHPLGAAVAIQAAQPALRSSVRPLHPRLQPFAVLPLAELIDLPEAPLRRY